MKRIMLISFIMIILLVLCGFSSQHEEKYEAISTDFKIMLSDQSITLDEPILAINNKAYLPVRAFANSLGFDVEWIDEERTIELSDSKTKVVDDNGEYTTPAVNKRETAIVIAEAFLKEQIPYAFDTNKEHFFTIEDETEDTWMVVGIAGLGDFLTEENYNKFFGLAAYVTISKKSGKIILLESDYSPDDFLNENFGD